jgi:hypothetical protein
MDMEGLRMAAYDPIFLAKLAVVAALYLFLPLTAITYYFFRYHRRRCEIERVLSMLDIEHRYRKAFNEGKPVLYFFGTLLYAMVVSAIGLALLAFSSELGITALPTVELRGIVFPQEGSWVVCGMSFLGAYLWGLQYLYRRYCQNDLLPAVFYGLSLRMILATAVALVLFNAAGAVGGTGEAAGGITANIWPAMALLIGMFPQRGLDWLMARVPFLRRLRAVAAEDAIRRARAARLDPASEAVRLLRRRGQGTARTQRAHGDRAGAPQASGDRHACRRHQAHAQRAATGMRIGQRRPRDRAPAECEPAARQIRR